MAILVPQTKQVDGQAQAENAVRDHELELSQLIDMVPSHLWRLTPDGEPTFFNKRMVDFIGLDIADMERPGSSRLDALAETIHPDDAARFRSGLMRCLQTGESFAMRYRLRRADGVYHWMSSRAEPMRDREGRILQWYGLCHDIDDQMQQDETLRRSEQRLQQLIDAVPINILSFSPSGKVTYVSKRYLDHLGLSQSHFEDFNSIVEELIHPEDASKVQRAVSDGFDTRKPFTVRFRRRERDGSYRWSEGRAEPLCEPDGTVVQWYVVSIDIDEEVRAQQALREREQELSVLVDMVPSHLWRVTAEGETTFLNKNMADFLGMEPEERVGVDEVMATIFHPDDVEAVNEVFYRCLRTGEVFSMNYRMRRHDGAYRWMSGRAEPMRDETGHIVQWFGLCHDIDDQVRAEDALRRASDRLAKATQAASLAELSASIAHEINQPLAAIVANSQACHRWLCAEPPNVERAKITADRITRDANSAAEVISSIRALFRRAPDARSSEDINRLVREVCWLMANETTGRNVRIKTDLEPDLPSVALDSIQIQQVFVNLIRNGIDAMDTVADSARTLQISSRRDGPGAIRIEVRDDGTGFKNSERVFEPFFTTKEHGMGMGLAICRSIIEAHGGRLWTFNNEPRGACVAFTVPLASSEAP